MRYRGIKKLFTKEKYGSVRNQCNSLPWSAEGDKTFTTEELETSKMLVEIRITSEMLELRGKSRLQGGEGDFT